MRTVSAWGEGVQGDLARLRVLVVGAVGLDLAIRLVQAGIQNVASMDFDTVEKLNLDRLITATRQDARLVRSKKDSTSACANRLGSRSPSTTTSSSAA
ncbi:ThiF family adenylyltransferase [Amycolatopsis lexingtonensis]|uniref:ThiF family adenylyltransferase n=1 Tax=Amycolatopsis lexingtonensis TaxID=218822 RepID=UPI0023EA7250|nr:ThiF family adenylyltransferase [Amycolatopsis lexingtonensis]